MNPTVEVSELPEHFDEHADTLHKLVDIVIYG